MAEALLVIREGEEAGREIALAGPTTIGRGEGADLTLADSGISRSHTRITPEGIGAVIEDLGSSNGTFVNTERVEEPRRLRDGDEIQLGSAVLVFTSGTEETRVMEPEDPDATEAHPGPAAAAAAAAAGGVVGGAAAATPPEPVAPAPTQPEPVEPAPTQPEPVQPEPVQPAEPEPYEAPAPAADAGAGAEGEQPWDPIPMPKQRRQRQPKAQPPPPPPPRREPAVQPQQVAQHPADEVNDYNLAALASIVMGPASILLLIFSSASAFYAALPIAICAVAFGTIGRNKVDRGESSRFRSLASMGRTFGIVGTILAAVILVAVIAINQFLDVSAENLGELIDEIKDEIQDRTS